MGEREKQTQNRDYSAIRGKIPVKVNAEPHQNRTIKIRKGELSTPQISTEVDEISSKSGHLWGCIERKPDKVEGYIYRFKLRDEYDDVTSNENLDARRREVELKNKQIFPAIEQPGSVLILNENNIEMYKAVKLADLTDIDDFEECSNLNKKLKMYRAEHPNQKFKQLDISGTNSLNKIKQEIKEYDVLKQLGYKVECNAKGVFLELPDKEALISRWETYRKAHPQLPPLDIVSSEGVASDIEFIKTYLTHDSLLSTGKEFVHDHQAHVIKAILRLLKDPQRHKKFEVIKKIEKSYRRLMLAQSKMEMDKSMSQEDQEIMRQKLEMLTAALGTLVDASASSSDYGVQNAQLEEDNQDRWISMVFSFHSEFNPLWEQRGINAGHDLTQFWEECKKIEDEL